jgi:hypothetical protein
MHPLHEALTAAAGGRFPPVDGAVEVLPPDVDGRQAVVEFTGHSFVLTDRGLDELRSRGADGFGGASQPDVVRWLAGPGAEIGSHDAVLVARGAGSGTAGLSRRSDLDGHPRVIRARRHRRDVTVYGDDLGLLTLGCGLVGRLELSVELYSADLHSRGDGRRLIAAGLALVPDGRLVWAQVAPGNASSLRAFLSSGFAPIGAETLIG